MDAILAVPMDVEELARLGRLKLQCPYYGGRAAVPEADLVLVPYSSLLVKVGVGMRHVGRCRQHRQWPLQEEARLPGFLGAWSKTCVG